MDTDSMLASYAILLIYIGNVDCRFDNTTAKVNKQSYLLYKRGDNINIVYIKRKIILFKTASSSQ